MNNPRGWFTWADLWTCAVQIFLMLGLIAFLFALLYLILRR